MKKLIIAALTMSLTAGLFAQGTINFYSSTGSSVNGRVYTNDMVAGHPTGLAQGSATPYNVALYWGVTGSTEAQLTMILSGVATTAAGKFNVGIATTGNATAPGASAVFEVKAWTGNYSSYEAAYAAASTGATLTDGAPVLVGTSGLFTNGTGGNGTPAAQPPPITGFTTQLILTPVPEPSTIALGGLGAAALLLFRRRK